MAARAPYVPAEPQIDASTTSTTGLRKRGFAVRLGNDREDMLDRRFQHR